MCDGPDPFQKQMSKQERHFSSIEFTWRYHPLRFIQNSVKHTEFCRVGKSHLEDNIRFRGAMSKLISDYSQVEISNKVKDILRMYHTSSWHSDPYHQNLNPSEWHFRTIKAWTNTILNRTGAPANCWFLCMSYVCYLLNHISCESLKGQNPSHQTLWSHP